MKFKSYTRNDLKTVAERLDLSKDKVLEMEAVSAVLPFRVNNYVLENLIDKDSLPNDPMYQLTFPHREMLDDSDFNSIFDLVATNADPNTIRSAANRVRNKLNPHPAGQMELNVPNVDGDKLDGIQHKYNETVLFFPAQGQTCHSYCSYCFRWAQFIGNADLKFASKETDKLIQYLKENPQVSSLLITGGDPMVMKTSILKSYIEPILNADLPNLHSIRIGTKALAYWPYRFTEGEEADGLMRLFESVKKAGKHLALMAHSSHPVELEPAIAEKAISRVISSGATIRAQAPLIKRVNDESNVWAELWRKQVRLGIIPYYMFVERDTGAKNYFEVPLTQAYQIFTKAYSKVAGLARTVRGPSMSTAPGKVMVDGITTIGNEKLFVLKMLQGRDPSWVNKVFFAKYDANATWLNELKPAFGEQHFFFEDKLTKSGELFTGK